MVRKPCSPRVGTRPGAEVDCFRKHWFGFAGIQTQDEDEDLVSTME